jgi:hypothetical protein
MNETITWNPVNSPPDDAITVLVLLPPAAGEPSWLGWFDSSKNTWRDAPPRRQPLTEDEVFANDQIMDTNAHTGLAMRWIAEYVRAVEKAHGIGGEE